MTNIRTTSGENFRIVDQLLTQIEHVQTAIDLTELTPELVDTTRQALLIGH